MKRKRQHFGIYTYAVSDAACLSFNTERIRSFIPCIRFHSSLDLVYILVGHANHYSLETTHYINT